MPYKLADIVFERGDYFVLRVKKGFEVYQNGVTCSTRKAIIGYEGEKGLTRAKTEIDRRIAAA